MILCKVVKFSPLTQVHFKWIDRPIRSRKCILTTMVSRCLQLVPHKQVNEISFFNGLNRITFETYR
jgi:hypothetical protein